jgi:hypothetical protein
MRRAGRGTRITHANLGLRTGTARAQTDQRDYLDIGGLSAPDTVLLPGSSSTSSFTTLVLIFAGRKPDGRTHTLRRGFFAGMP